MILVDTSIWIDHLRAGDATLRSLLEQGEVLVHPWVTGELALGTLADRDEILDLLGNQPQALLAPDDEILHLRDDSVSCRRACYALVAQWRHAGGCRSRSRS